MAYNPNWRVQETSGQSFINELQSPKNEWCMNLVCVFDCLSLSKVSGS